VDEVSGMASPGSRFDQLPPDPRRRRTRGDVEMDQLTAVVPDDEENVEDSKPDRLDDQEIRRPDPLELVGEECPPRLAASMWCLAPSIAPD